MAGKLSTETPTPVLPYPVLAPVTNPELRVFAVDALVHASNTWELFWKGDGAARVDKALDYDVLVAWITAVFRRHLYTLYLREKPLLMRGQGADAVAYVNPLESLADKLGLDIDRLERRIRFGVGT